MKLCLCPSFGLKHARADDWVSDRRGLQPGLGTIAAPPTVRRLEYLLHCLWDAVFVDIYLIYICYIKLPNLMCCYIIFLGNFFYCCDFNSFCRSSEFAVYRPPHSAPRSLMSPLSIHPRLHAITRLPLLDRYVNAAFGSLPGPSSAPRASFRAHRRRKHNRVFTTICGLCARAQRRLHALSDHPVD